MEVVRGHLALKGSWNHSVITIGNFDGVHLGHAEIINRTLAKAKELGGNAVVYTFRPHPQVALRPEAALQLLNTYDEKLEILESLGVGVVIEEPFSREFSTIVPEQFFNEVLLRQLSARAIVVGYDFAFGKGREGHMEALASFCEAAGVELTVVPAMRVNGQVVSSSKIRELLGVGDVNGAAALMGRPFFYRGVVVKGEGRGRKIGFPTANLKLESKLALPNGVYVTEAVLAGKKYPSITNVGVRPTFEVEDRAAGKVLFPAVIETHLLDCDIDLYGSTLEVKFLARIRSEMKFGSIEDLKRQIAGDIASSRSSHFS